MTRTRRLGTKGLTRRLGTKGPRLRYPPGSFMTMADNPGVVYEVVRAYRLIQSPSEWVYQLEIRHAGGDMRPTTERHEVWYAPRSRPPDHVSTNIRTGNWCQSFSMRTVSNQDMIRLADHWVGDVMEG